MYLADQDSSRVAKCEVFYTDQIFQTKLYPKKSAQVATNLTIKLNEIEMNDHFWVEKVENSITKSWFKDKTSSKLVEFAPKTLNFIKIRGFLDRR